MNLQEAIDMLSLAARSSTWQSANPKVAGELLEVIRDANDSVFRAHIARDHMRNERDVARDEVEQLK